MLTLLSLVSAPPAGNITGTRQLSILPAISTSVPGTYVTNITPNTSETAVLRLLTSGQQIGQPTNVLVVAAAAATKYSTLTVSAPSPLVAGASMMLSMRLADAFNNTVQLAEAMSSSVRYNGEPE